ncbi:hypothetical protein [Roseisolibacter agri]|uniref:Uncharacterized protein n=1 Tax=Roseisolibacter agri TaxID=2014610 RepID=A0AA37QEZ8_9BACT|nr:hypothetical protein [Roseisolibacter agri]GLC24518.1 hypothetical protein rosag_10310 [Roseisolibacter agri]
MPQQHPEIPAAPPVPPPVQFPAGSPAAEVFGARTAVSVPTTAREMRALRSRRSELSNQLNSAADRRERLVNELRRMPEGQAREGVEQRIQLLDQRILQLETDIAQTGQLVVAAPAELLTSSSEATRIIQTGGPRIDVAPIGVAFTLAVLMPIAIAFARRIWKRTGAAPVRAASREDTERLMRLEQAVDTIAVEVERISEGQRFVTQLLAHAQEQRQLAPVPTLEAAAERR